MFAQFFDMSLIQKWGLDFLPESKLTLVIDPPTENSRINVIQHLRLS